MDSTPIGLRIRRLRILRNMTQEQLAHLSGKSERWLRYIESGKGAPDTNTVKELSRVLRFEVSVIMGLEPIPGTRAQHDIAQSSTSLINYHKVSQGHFQRVNDPGVIVVESSQAVNRKIMNEMRIAADFARRIAAGTTNEITLDQIDADVHRLALEYVSQPLCDLFLDICRLRSEVFGLIQQNRFPDQIRHLHLSASRLCGLQAHICLDLGHYAEAETVARTAWLCADLAGHGQMRGWVRALQSLIAYWDGRTRDAIDLAYEGTRYALRGWESVRLPALQARAAAALGNFEMALEALSVAQEARNNLCPEDQPGGVFTFPEAKQATYAGTTLLSFGTPDMATRAMTESQRAIELYLEASPMDRSSGDLLAAHLDLAVSHLACDDIDGVGEEVAIVLAVPLQRRTASIRKRALRLAKQLHQPHYQSIPKFRHIREDLMGFCSEPSSLPSDDPQSNP